MSSTIGAVNAVEWILRDYARAALDEMRRTERINRRLGWSRTPWNSEPIGLGVHRCPSDPENPWPLPRG